MLIIFRVVYDKQLFHKQSFKVFINWHFIAKTMLYYLFTNSTKKSNDKSKFRMALLLPCHSKWLCCFKDTQNGIATEMTIWIALIADATTIRIGLLLSWQLEWHCCYNDTRNGVLLQWQLESHCGCNDTRNGIAAAMTIRMALLLIWHSECHCCCNDT